MVNNIRKKRKQEYNWKEVECESCGCKVQKCNWLRHLGTKKHTDVVEKGGGGGDRPGGEVELYLLDNY